MSEEDKKRLAKAGIHDLLSFALCAPRNYKDYRLAKFPTIGDVTLDVRIQLVQKHPKFIKMSAFAHNINQNIELIFFHLTSYHFKTFQEGNSLAIHGKLEKRYGKWQMIQPQKVANYKLDKIFPVYKVPIRGDMFEELKKRYLTKELLSRTGLPADIVKALLKIHYPDEAFYKEWQKEGSFWGEYLDALKFAEIFHYLQSLRQRRVYQPSISQEARGYEEFLRSLPFEATVDQKKAIQDIYTDLQKSIAARRVIVGDVGSGKSLVMFAAAYMNYPNKTILMAPTTILAAQLYEEAKRFLPSYVKTVLVSSQTKGSFENAHFIIGTHALLFQNLPKATVIMVDEQHRFGTNQRNKLKKLLEEGKKSPHFFQFSATPIPRTQAMMESELVDFSFIKQTPFKKDIDTYVIGKKDFKQLLQHIQKELQKGHQVLVVYPLVEESEQYEYKSLEEAKSFWQHYFNGVYVTHGKDSQKDEVLKAFREHGRILLATTVVEVGISLPRLSTIVIVGAENMGLATLHQLRGRVSRTGLKGYCFLYTNDPDNKRLQEFAKIRSGFEVAELDLKYRKSGDIVTGKEQSGKAFKWIEIAKDKEIVEKAKARLDSLTKNQ